MDAQTFKEQFDEDGYVILRDFIPIELMNNARVAVERIVDALAGQSVANGDIPHAFKDESNNARVAVERIVDALAGQSVANGDIPHAFKDESFELQFKKLFENEPNSGLIQFTSELHQPEFYDLYTYQPMLDLAQSYLGDELRMIILCGTHASFSQQTV